MPTSANAMSNLPSLQLLEGAQINLLAQQSALSEARCIVQQEQRSTAAGAKQTGTTEHEKVHILTKQLEEMRENYEALRRKTEQRTITTTPLERMAQVLQTDDENRKQYERRFAGTWVDNRTPQREHSIEDGHIVNQETGTKRRLTYLTNARITVTSDALPRTMHEVTLDADDNIITWTSDNTKVGPSMRMTISKWYRKPTISSGEFRLQLTEVQTEKERHTTKMSNVEKPKAIAPQREHQKGTGSTTREERPVQN